MDDYTQAVASLNQQRARGAADLWQQAARENENYGVSTQNLARNFSNLGLNQTDAARAAGVAEGGALQQALEKRAANQHVEQTALDVSHARAGADIATQAGRLNENVDQGLAGQLLGYQRGTTDRNTTLSRAQRENAFYGADTAAEQWYQAAQGGYVAPGRPRNEHGSGSGAYQVQSIHGQHVMVNPAGRVIGRVPKKGPFGMQQSSQAIGF